MILSLSNGAACALIAGYAAMRITVYAPDSGDGISGSGAMASGAMPYIGAAACPSRLKFDTRVELTGRAKLRAIALRIPWQLVCEDRFADPVREGIDIALPANFEGLSNEQRIELAKVYGVMRDVPLVTCETRIAVSSEQK